MADRIRYFIGVVGVVILPTGLLFWLLIHPFARWWRKLGPARTYSIVVPAVVVIGAWLFRVRRPLLGADLGTNWTLIGIAAVLYGAMIWLERQYWRHLNFTTLVGIPELSPAGKQESGLLREGIYGVVRHPRYLSAGVGLAANALVVNYTGFYWLLLFLLPPGYLLLVLEERELIGRFGESYREYQRKVPRLIPRLRRSR